MGDRNHICTPVSTVLLSIYVDGGAFNRNLEYTTVLEYLQKSRSHIVYVDHQYVQCIHVVGMKGTLR